MSGTSSVIPNLYQNTADYYDLGNLRASVAVDVKFYKELIPEHASVLEIGCGTGRVSIELAKNGRSVVGVDLSLPMLNVLKSKSESNGVSLEVEQSDMREFNLGRTFDWVIFPFRVFQAMTTDEDRQLCLRAMKQHMNRESRALLCLFDPHPDVLNGWGKKGQIDFDVATEGGGMSIRRISNQLQHNAEKQTIAAEYVIEKYQGETVVEHRTDLIELGYLYRDQMRELLCEEGLEILHEYAGYERQKFESSVYSEQIYIVGKKQ